MKHDGNSSEILKYLLNFISGQLAIEKHFDEFRMSIRFQLSHRFMSKLIFLKLLDVYEYILTQFIRI